MTIVTNVVIVDNHRAFGEQLQAFLRDQLRCTVLGLAADASAGLNLVYTTRPDFALVDVGLPGENGFCLTGRLTDLQLGVRVVLMGYGESIEYVQAATRAGAMAYMPK